jgi:hypothetical protein
MIAKRLIHLIAPEDTAKQCAKDPACHRLNGHPDACKSLGVVLVEKAEHAAKRLITRLRGAA